MASQYPDHPCLGKRIGDEYKWITYQETKDRIDAFSKGMLKEGLAPWQEDGWRAIGIFALN